MIYELARALVQRIFRDKILMALVVIGVLGLFMGGMSGKQEPPVASKSGGGQPMDRGGDDTRSMTPASLDGQPGAAPAQQPLEPNLATDFVKWWLGGAMDYTTATAVANHEQAFGWMTPEAQRAFQAAFWTPETQQMIASGQLVAAFHLAAVQAEALNPDGSVVVGVTGTLVTDTGGKPTPHQLTADLLVRREQDGLRIAGIYNRVTTVPGVSVY